MIFSEILNRKSWFFIKNYLWPWQLITTNGLWLWIIIHEYLQVWCSQNGTVRQSHVVYAYVEVPVVNTVTSLGRDKNGLYPYAFFVFDLASRANDCRQNHQNYKIRWVIWCSHICYFWLLENVLCLAGPSYRDTCAWVLNIRKSLKK